MARVNPVARRPCGTVSALLVKSVSRYNRPGCRALTPLPSLLNPRCWPWNSPVAEAATAGGTARQHLSKARQPHSKARQPHAKRGNLTAKQGPWNDVRAGGQGGVTGQKGRTEAERRSNGVGQVATGEGGTNGPEGGRCCDEGTGRGKLPCPGTDPLAQPAKWHQSSLAVSHTTHNDLAL